MSDSVPKLSQNNNKIYAIENQPTMAWTAKPKKPTDLSVLAFIVTLLFNHILGFIAYHFTASARHCWDLNDYKKSKRHTRYAKIFIILGIIFGVATYATAITLYITLKSDSPCSTAGGSSFKINDNLKTTSKARITTQPTITSIATTTVTASGNETTTCCQHCPTPNDPTNTGEPKGSKAVTPPNTCNIYCSTTGNGPIYPDLTQKYRDCCFELACFSNF